MKRALIVTLVCLNLALIVVLVLGASTPPARAQAFRGGADYLMVTAAFSSSNDAVYVLDMAQRRLVALAYDKTAKRLLPMRGRQLERDFRQQRETPGR